MRKNKEICLLIEDYTEISKPSIIGKIYRHAIRKLFDDPNRPVLLSDILTNKVPRLAGAEPINICNADCSFCGYGKGEKGKAADPRKKIKLNSDVLKHTLDLFSKGGGGVFSLTPILGEITAHPLWLEYIKMVRNYDNITGVSCYTNAILLDKFGFDNILKSGLSTLYISTALGSREQYKRLYGKDKYEKVLANIYGILEENKKLGEPVFITLGLRIDKPYDYFYSSDVYRELLKLLPKGRIQILENWDDFKGIIKKDKLPIGHEFKEEKYIEKKDPCYALFRKLEVTVDGTIQGCSCRVEPELWSDNILDHDTIESAWKNKKIEKIRLDWFNGNVPNCCVNCSHYIPYTSLLKGSSPKVVSEIIISAISKRFKNLVSSIAKNFDHKNKN